MKTRIAMLALALAMVGSRLVMAGEHPHEHPTSGKEHPTEMKKEHAKEHPKEHPHKKSQESGFQDEYEKVVKEYVDQEAKKTGGVYTVTDDVMKKEWKLQLSKVHKTKICMLQAGKTCFACADFKEVGGKSKLDLDFYAVKGEDGKISMEKVLIHKVNGKPRFTYDKDNNMVPQK